MTEKKVHRGNFKWYDAAKKIAHIDGFELAVTDVVSAFLMTVVELKGKKFTRCDDFKGKDVDFKINGNSGKVEYLTTKIDPSATIVVYQPAGKVPIDIVPPAGQAPLAKNETEKAADLKKKAIADAAAVKAQDEAQGAARLKEYEEHARKLAADKAAADAAEAQGFVNAAELKAKADHAAAEAAMAAKGGAQTQLPNGNGAKHDPWTTPKDRRMGFTACVNNATQIVIASSFIVTPTITSDEIVAEVLRIAHIIDAEILSEAEKLAWK